MQNTTESKIKKEYELQFGEVRKLCLKLWKKSTLRTRGFKKFNDNISKSLECKWQRKYTTNSQKHNSFYCSLGEWNNHITDLLSDKTYDTLNFNNIEQRKCLFRQYTRIMLITSEILTDFKDFLNFLSLIKLSKNEKKEKVEFNLDIIPLNFNDILAYINSICKHKFSTGENSNKYHIKNHHVEYLFEDELDGYLVVNPIYENADEENFINDLYVPKLEYLIRQILHCYKIVDRELKLHYADHKIKLQKLEIDTNLL